MRGFEVVEGAGGKGDNMHGWASVDHGVDICLSYNTAHSKKDKQKRQTKYRKTKRESRVTKDHSTKYVVSLY